LSKYRIKDIISELRSEDIKATQAGMAKAAGVPQSYVSRIVNNQTKAVDPNILFAIANYLTEVSNQKFTIAHLFYEEESTAEPDSLETPADPESQDDEALRAIERLENRVDKGFAEVDQQIADVRNEIGKLNQHGQ
jgi:transcriptional regulator with XRE-family HTH domain